MKRLVLATLLVACTNKADVGVNGQPVTCKPTAMGEANGTVTNPTTHNSYTFGTVAATLSPNSPAAPTSVMLRDTSLQLSLAFSCGQTALGMYDVGAGQIACPFMVNSAVNGDQQQIYASGHSGVVILDQNTDCLAGRYDVQLGYTMDSGAYVSEGEVAGWFSIPLQ
jgi:hypothetical protein